MDTPIHRITKRFDDAASYYDAAANLQAQVAKRLVHQANLSSPQTILDIGCGTGFVCEALRERFPQAELTGLDSAAHMLQQAQMKVPGLNIVHGDAANLHLHQRYDAVFSSMMLHWLPNPLAALRQWEQCLKPGGSLHVAVLTNGSFQEWRDHCAVHGVSDGLWTMPSANFADSLGYHTEQQAIAVTCSSAQSFLNKLKKIGADSARAGHQPVSVTVMRRLLQTGAKPFPVTYSVLYIVKSLQGKS